MSKHCTNCGFSVVYELSGTYAQPQPPIAGLIDAGHQPLRFFCEGCPLSHVATVDVEIKDLVSLRKACDRLGLELVEGQETYKWYGESVGDYPLPAGFQASDLGKCSHAIRLRPDSPVYTNQAYEIGVVARRDGRPGYQLLWDFYCGGFGLQDHVGEGCAKLKQAYANEVAKRTAIQQGFRVQETVNQNGSIRLVLSK